MDKLTFEIEVDKMPDWTNISGGMLEKGKVAKEYFAEIDQQLCEILSMVNIYFAKKGMVKITPYLGLKNIDGMVFEYALIDKIYNFTSIYRDVGGKLVIKFVQKKEDYMSFEELEKGINFINSYLGL